MFAGTPGAKRTRSEIQMSNPNLTLTLALNPLIGTIAKGHT